MKIQPSKRIQGDITVSGDKSISHRSVLIGALADGDSHVSNFLNCEDCASTVRCMESLGVKTELDGSNITVHGVGIDGFKPPQELLYAGNSGTTARLLLGLMAGQNFDCEISGDDSLRRRPMDRVITPLKLMGGNISTDDGQIKVHASRLSAIEYTLPVASAQLKSALLLAGLYADGETTIIDTGYTRNHTELMLKRMGADIVCKGSCIKIKPSRLHPMDIAVPSDISSAAYFMAAALCAENGSICVRNVGINPSRTGFIDVIRGMGAQVQMDNMVLDSEFSADITVKNSKLHGIEISGVIIPRLIDEIPIIAVLAAYAEGKTVIGDIGELRYKETDRISAIIDMLKCGGVRCNQTEDSIIIYGKKSGGAARRIKACTYESYGDHRIAMSAAILALMSNDESTINNCECVNISFPSFFDTLAKITG